MNLLTKILWVVSIALTAAAWWYGHLTFWLWCLIVFCTVILITMFKPKDEFDSILASMSSSSRLKTPYPDARIRIADAERIRNTMLRHQEERRTDTEYQSSEMCRDATFAIQTLNASIQSAKVRHD